MNNKDSVLRTPSDYHSKDHSFNLTVSFKILLVPLLTVMMSCSVVGAFETDDPYGPVVNCDADQPMDDLLKCVEKEYNKRTRGIQNLKAMDTDKIYEKRRENTYFLPTKYRKINEFPSIKECYTSNACVEHISKNGWGYVRKDVYKKVMGVRQDDPILTGIIYIDKNNPISIWREAIWVSSFSTAPYRYSRSHREEKDIIISETNNKLILYATLVEKISVTNKKDLFVVNIQRLCPANPNSRPNTISKDLYEYSKFNGCGVYRFEYIKNRDVIDEKSVSISLDRRINPKYIYLKIGMDIFEIDTLNNPLIYE